MIGLASQRYWGSPQVLFVAPGQKVTHIFEFELEHEATKIVRVVAGDRSAVVSTQIGNEMGVLVTDEVAEVATPFGYTCRVSGHGVKMIVPDSRWGYPRRSRWF